MYNEVLEQVATRPQGDHESSIRVLYGDGDCSRSLGPTVPGTPHNSKPTVGNTVRPAKEVPDTVGV